MPDRRDSSSGEGPGERRGPRVPPVNRLGHKGTRQTPTEGFGPDPKSPLWFGRRSFIPLDARSFGVSRILSTPLCRVAGSSFRPWVVGVEM